MAKAKRKILWAVDVFQPEKEIQQHVIETLKALSEPTGAEIFPVYVLSPDPLNLTMELDDPWVKTYKPAVEKSLHHLIQNSGLSRVAPPKVLTKPSPSLRNAVKSLAAYAASMGAEVIVTGSQGRKGLARLALGSFAETLLLHSKVPVLVVGHESKSPGAFKKILFPTDLSKASITAFLSAIDLAKNLGASLHVLHIIPHPIEPVVQSGVYLLGGGWVPVPEYLESAKGKLQKRVGDLAEKASKKGVSATTQILNSAPSITQGVLDTVKSERADLIAMAAQSGPVASALMGSVTRQVVRHASVPTWVMRPGSRK
jgi:nucleotide-binding universal stress UspA family protein